MMRQLSALWHDSAGAVIIETAFVTPALLLMSLGGYQVSQVVARQHRITSYNVCYTKLLRVDLADGYIHLSAEPQVVGTLDKHFVGQDGLWLARVDLQQLGDAVRWEVSRGGALFPHVYAPLPLAAVTALAPLERTPDGTVIYPA